MVGVEGRPAIRPAAGEAVVEAADGEPRPVTRRAAGAVAAVDADSAAAAVVDSAVVAAADSAEQAAVAWAAGSSRGGRQTQVVFTMTARGPQAAHREAGHQRLRLRRGARRYQGRRTGCLGERGRGPGQATRRPDPVPPARRHGRARRGRWRWWRWWWREAEDVVRAEEAADMLLGETIRSRSKPSAPTSSARS